MTAKTEAAVIRSQLKLRRNRISGNWEVYTTLHGSGIFKWFVISKERLDWYLQTFDLTVSDIVESPIVDEASGAIIDNFQPIAGV
jgi:hypothetical protein